jgi:copper(I)-binding protein
MSTTRPATRLRGWRLLPIALLIVAAVAACAQPAAGGIVVDDVWARPATPAGLVAQAPLASAGPAVAGQPSAAGTVGVTSAVYLVIHNRGSEVDRLIAARSPVAVAVELHRTTMEGGMMTMTPVAAIEAPAGGRVELKPGGPHIMLIGLTRALAPGDRVPLTLEFERSGVQSIEATVRQP